MQLHQFNVTAAAACHERQAAAMIYKCVPDTCAHWSDHGTSLSGKLDGGCVGVATARCADVLMC